MPWSRGVYLRPKTRPGYISLVVDGTEFISGRSRQTPIHWTPYNNRVASANGVYWHGNCKPACGEYDREGWGKRRLFMIADQARGGVFRRLRVWWWKSNPANMNHGILYAAQHGSGGWGWNELGTF